VRRVLAALAQQLQRVLQQLAARLGPARLQQPSSFLAKGLPVPLLFRSLLAVTYKVVKILLLLLIIIIIVMSIIIPATHPRGRGPVAPGGRGLEQLVHDHHVQRVKQQAAQQRVLTVPTTNKNIGPRNKNKMASETDARKRRDSRQAGWS
jgi:hypothetical protein